MAGSGGMAEVKAALALARLMRRPAPLFSAALLAATGRGRLPGDEPAVAALLAGPEAGMAVLASLLAQTGLAQTGLAQTGLAQTGLAQTGLAQTGPDDERPGGRGGRRTPPPLREATRRPGPSRTPSGAADAVAAPGPAPPAASPRPAVAPTAAATAAPALGTGNTPPPRGGGSVADSRAALRRALAAAALAEAHGARVEPPGRPAIAGPSSVAAGAVQPVDRAGTAAAAAPGGIAGGILEAAPFRAVAAWGLVVTPWRPAADTIQDAIRASETAPDSGVFRAGPSLPARPPKAAMPLGIPGGTDRPVGNAVRVAPPLPASTAVAGPAATILAALIPVPIASRPPLARLDDCDVGLAEAAWRHGVEQT